MARTRYRRSNECARIQQSPSPEWVAGRAERLAGYVAEGGLQPADVVAAAGREGPARRHRWADVVSSLAAALSLTVLVCGKGVAVVRCPHCAGRREVHQWHQVANWLSRGRVPRCRYGTCETEVPNA